MKEAFAIKILVAIDTDMGICKLVYSAENMEDLIYSSNSNNECYDIVDRRRVAITGNKVCISSIYCRYWAMS
jgi:hypothetical protein